MFRISISALALTIAGSACTDQETLPSAPSAAPFLASSLGNLTQPSQVRTLREDFKNIALRAPGFAGVWLDSQGNLMVSAASTELSPVLRGEVIRWLAGYGRPELAGRPWKLNRVEYDYAALVGFLERAKTAAAHLAGVNSFGIEVKTGRILVGVEDATAAAAVTGALSKERVPEGARAVQVFGREPDLQAGLQSTFTYLRGGIQIARAYGAECSVGFVGYGVDAGGNPDYSNKVVTTAAHCTSSQLAMNGDIFGQPSPGRLIGREVRIAQVYPQFSAQCGSSYTYCRYADVALIQVDDSIPVGHGTAAISSATSSPNNPPYLGWRSYTGSGVTGALVGETVTKVGRTSGQTTGVVTQACVDRQSTITPGLWTLCASNASATTGGGDSGGTVYIPYSASNSTTPRAVGVLFQGGPGSTWFSPAGFVLVAMGSDLFLFW
ncbi:MAG: S1 family peptidase [Gemmatimonadaceae bacterium]|nr:S1 family peptidase [Gemmatimonadaceae bacterium]